MDIDLATEPATLADLLYLVQIVATELILERAEDNPNPLHRPAADLEAFANKIDGMAREASGRSHWMLRGLADNFFHTEAP